jgi:hypothetical protein
VNKNSGVYRPLGAIIVKEGGWNDPDAIAGSKRLAMKCCLMGGQWVSRNPLTERLEFFYLRREVADEMAEAWTLCEQESKKVDAVDKPGSADAGADAAVDGGKPVGGKPKERTPNKEDNKKKGVGKKQVEAVEGGGKKESTPQKEKSIFASALMVKSKWLSTVTTANTLILRINDPTSEWHWAKNDQNLGRLQGKLQDLASVESSFSNDFLIQDMATFKKKLTKDRLSTELSTFVGLQTYVIAVQRETDRLTSMHKLSK